MSEYQTDQSNAQYGAAPAQPNGYVQQPYAQNTGYYAQGQYAYQAPQPSQPAKEKKGSGVKTFFIAFAGALVAFVVALGGFGIYGAVSSAVSGLTGQQATVTATTDGSSQSITINASEEPTVAEAVAAKCLPSVVAVDEYVTMSEYYELAYGDSYGYGFGYGYGYSGSDSDEKVKYGTGSGVVLSADGYIITNYHVVEDGSSYIVTIEGKEYDAELIGYDASSDIAVLKAQNASGLTPIEIGDSSSLVVGEWVMTLGSPFGLEQSVATGIVSATSRSQVYSDSESTGYSSSSSDKTYYVNMIQTDAAINPGNSGGALVDAEGKLIGINTLFSSYSGSYAGVGFAIPVDYAYRLAQQIIAGETPSHAQLGVTLNSVTSSMAQRYGLSVSEGAYVASVVTGGAAETAGIQVGDIITQIDGVDVASASDLILEVRGHEPGDTITVTFDRNGKEMEVQATLGSDAESETSTGATVQQESSGTTVEDLYNQLFNNGRGNRTNDAV